MVTASQADRVVPPAKRQGHHPDLPWSELDGYPRHAACLLAARDGDRDALDVLVQDLSPLVYHVARAQGLDRTTTEDVTQTVWLAFLRNLDRISEPRSLARWLITATRREALRALRVHAETQPLADEVADRIRSTDGLPEQTALGRDRDRLLREAFARLPLRDQKVLQLTVLDGSSNYAEVARELEITRSSVGTTRSRAIRRVRDQFDELMVTTAHHTIIAVDIVGFGDPSRTNMNQVRVRRGMYTAMGNAFAAAGVPWESCRHEDRGDGILILVPADVPKALFVDRLPDSLAEELTKHNRTHPVEERLHLRCAVHAGEISYDERGVTSSSIAHTFRLLDSDAVRAAFTRSHVLAIVSSDWFYDEVIRHSEQTKPMSYRPITITNKQTTARAWVRLVEPTRG